MLNDFEDIDRPQYRKVHVLFTDSLDQRFFKLISASKGFIKKLVKNSFKEMYCQLDIVSDNCVQMGIDYLGSVYSKDNNREKEKRA